MKAAGIVISIGMFLLTTVGLVAVASMCVDTSSMEFHPPFGWLKELIVSFHFSLLQLGFAGIGVVAAVLVARVRPSAWFRPRILVAAVVLSLVGLALVHVPGLGAAHKGSARWIALGPIRGQPSEFVKLAAILVTAWWVGNPALDRRSFVRSALVPAAWIGTLVLGLMAEPDLGSSLMLLAVNGALMFVSGVRIRYLVILAAVAAIPLGAYVLHNPERRSRVETWLGLRERTEQVSSAGGRARDPEAYQLEMGLTAFKRGGATGAGFGDSLLKHSYLPEHHTDFILAMIGEQMGLAATLPCLLVFLAMAFAGFVVALRVPDPRVRLLALGLSLHLCLSGAVNVGVVTGAFPTKGLALPFVSYGGSNLVASLLAGGLLLGIAWGTKPRTGRFEDEPPPEPRRGEQLSVGWGL